MLIQCPSCRARAKLSDDHEGAKVRCAECGRVYLARPAGAKGAARGTPNTGLIIGAFVGVLALIVVVFIVKSTGSETPVTKAAPVVAAPPPAAVDFGWRSELVQGVVALHNAAHAGDRGRVKTMLHGPAIWTREHTDEAGVLDPSAPEFMALPSHERAAAMDRWAEELVAGAAKDLVAEWVPYDGEALEVEDDQAVVRVAVKPRAGGIENRWVEWRLARDDGRFKAWSWERWTSPEEAKAEQRPKGYEKVTLSDGSIVHERAPEPLEHLEDTPPELRARIDGLVATMLDLELTKEGARARRELIEIGRPAIPILLTRFYEIPVDTEENRIRCNIIDQTLQSITGQHFGYAPGEAGSAAGTTEERRDSSIKQWFAWWYKNQKRFTEKKTDDALEGLIELDAAEKAWLERNSDD
jgi:predicted Zn finger-like uncharacterized protein